MKEIEITTGMNGYPKGLHKGFIDFGSFEEAEKFAKDNNGKVVLLHQRDGWQQWESRGQEFGPMKITEEDFGDDYRFIESREEWEKDCREWLKDMLDDNVSLEDINKELSDMLIVAESCDDLDEGEVLVTYQRKYYDSQKLETMSFSFDTDNYEIGVEIDNE